jgi:lactate dehydrogenase-like 2-hydroxyacid dehydrogenase
VLGLVLIISQLNTGKGICVFNTPGAYANAVVDLVFPMIGVWMRNIYTEISFCETLKSVPPEDVNKQVEAKKAVFRGSEIAWKNLEKLSLISWVRLKLAKMLLEHIFFSFKL